MPKVSVVLTSFNHEKYIRQAIDSVLDQTFTDYELIIWDDASSDDSWRIINSYSHSRILAFRNSENRRIAYGFNKAISEVATGEYIAIHHSDDAWEPNKLREQVAFLDSHPKIVAVFTQALAIGENGEPLEDTDHFYYSIFNQPNRTRHKWLNYFFNHGNALCHPSVLLRKTSFNECGSYRFGLAQLTDLDLWIRLCLQYEIHVFPEKLVKFRVRDNEANASGSRPETRIRAMYEFYKILQHYRQIRSFDELVKVFPSAEKYRQGEAFDVDFILGMISLAEKPYVFTQLFGLELLFEAISDPKRSATIKRLYNFDYKSFVDLTTKHDVFSLEAITDRDGQIANLHQAATARDGQIASLHQAAAARDGQIADLHRAIAERDNELRSIYASKKWKLIMKMASPALLTKAGISKINARMKELTEHRPQSPQRGAA